MQPTLLLPHQTYRSDITLNVSVVNKSDLTATVWRRPHLGCPVLTAPNSVVKQTAENNLSVSLHCEHGAQIMVNISREKGLRKKTPQRDSKVIVREHTFEPVMVRPN